MFAWSQTASASLGVSTSGGSLLSGLFFGWLRNRWPECREAEDWLSVKSVRIRLNIQSQPDFR
ncbi:MAG: hypothetical protein K2J28_07225 [Duncaniella sp.]|nr:hypothetical protein [Duncaniella sp.]